MKKNKFNIWGALMTFVVFIMVVLIGNIIIDKMGWEINHTIGMRCNQWCCGCVLPNGSLSCMCTDTLYDLQTDECVLVLSGQRENWSDKVCPFKRVDVLN